MGGGTGELSDAGAADLLMVALVQALIRGLEVDCGCFGSGEPSVWKTWLALGRDVVSLGMVAWIWKGDERGDFLGAGSHCCYSQ